LIAVDRAAAELRRGGAVVVTAPGAAPLLAIAAEAGDAGSLGRLERLAGAPPRLFVTGRRASVLGLAPGTAEVVALDLPRPMDEALVAVLSDPGRRPATETAATAATIHPTAAPPPAIAAVRLCKLARLLPAALCAAPPASAAESGGIRAWAAERNVLVVEAAAVSRYHETAARTLRLVGEARVPLVGAEDTRILAFRPGDGGIEHLAILIGQPDPEQPVLTRLHSECFTGDLLGSLRCDCGDQLRGAIEAIAANEAGNRSGVLLYLSQEGRGIGLVNKLRAYQLQDEGYDTLDANGQLGFDDDERIYQPAAEMLRQLGMSRVRLMTNNPGKVDALARHGVSVEERVPHVFPSNVHNLSYLRTKAGKGGHLF
jgi:GTP cyclohydrolase II